MSNKIDGPYLELGQTLFGNPVGKYNMPEFAEALFGYIRGEIHRVYWNINKKQWDEHESPELPGVEWRPYCWSYDKEEAAKPNFVFGGVEIRWYKYPGRGMTANIKWTERKWRGWFDSCLDHVRNYEDSKLGF